MQKPWDDQTPMPRRIAGLFMLAFGLFGLFIGLVVPLLQRVPPSFYCFGVSAVALPSLVLGIAHVVLGTRAVPIFGEPQTFKSWPRMYWIPLAFLGFLATLLVRWHLGG